MSTPHPTAGVCRERGGRPDASPSGWVRTDDDRRRIEGCFRWMTWSHLNGCVSKGSCCSRPRGPVPNLAEYVAGEPIRGSWWGHPAGHEIFAALTRVLSSPDVIATRLVNGKITLIHRRLWPALVRIADRFPAERLAAVDEEHTASGAHRTTRIPSLNGSPPKTSLRRSCSATPTRS